MTPKQEPRIIEPRERIIVALDLSSGSAARAIMEELRGSVGAFKIGLQLFTAAGPAFVREAAESGFRIFLDLKFHDIPNTTAMAGIEAARLGVWMFNIHAAGGGEMMKRTADDVHEACIREHRQMPLVTAVTVLTSSDDSTLAECGITRNAEEQALIFAKLAAQCGLDGVVASARDSTAIRENCPDKGFVIVSPGVRSARGTKDDQKRVMTPADAVIAGSDYLVIGRPILGAGDRIAAVDEIVSEVEAALM